MGMTVGFVAKATGGKLGGGADSAARVTGAVLDSRKVSPGDLFIAARGEHSDGHSFVDSARKHGAVLALVERPVDAPHVLVPDVTTALGDLARAHLVHLRKVVGRIRVAAITGSVGKTTTKDLLARIAAGAGNTVASQASYNNHFGVPLTVLRADETTDFLIVEIGANHRGEIAALSAIAPPDVACVLAVAPAHLGEFGSIEEVAAAKAELLGALRPGGTAVLNNADPRVRAMHTGDAARLTFGAAPDAQLCIEEVSVDPEGRIAIVLKLLGGVRRIATGMRGEHHATNLAAAAASALALGIGEERVVAGLSGAAPDSPHRMALVETPGGGLVLDDSYNANPTSTAAALSALADLARRTSRRPIAVLGEMRELGEHADAAHREAGREAVRVGVERLIVVGDGALLVADGALDAGMRRSDVLCVASVDDAREALGHENPEDALILIKGSFGSGLWKLADVLTQGGTPW